MPLTTKRIAQLLSISDSEAYSLARGLLVIGVLEEAGSIKEEGKRGRGQTVYKLSTNAAAQFLSKLELFETPVSSGAVFDAEMEDGI